MKKNEHDFLFGVSNMAAVEAAAYSILSAPDKGYPVYIYGYPCTGRSHLLHTLANIYAKELPTRKMKLIKAESFVNECIAGLREGRLPTVIEEYASSDVLLVDDIEYLAGKDYLQQKFANLTERMTRDGKSVIVTANCPPYLLKDMNSELIARLTSGEIVPIEPADDLMIKRILCRRMNLEFSDNIAENMKEEIADLLVSKHHLSLDQMVTSIKRMASVAELMEQKVTMELAEKVLKR